MLMEPVSELASNEDYCRRLGAAAQQKIEVVACGVRARQLWMPIDGKRVESVVMNIVTEWDTDQGNTRTLVCEAAFLVEGPVSQK